MAVSQNVAIHCQFGTRVSEGGALRGEKKSLCRNGFDRGI
jgi:hypothetical protein